MIFIIAGMGYKLAVVPFHAWSPDVYQGAPTPVTAFFVDRQQDGGIRVAVPHPDRSVLPAGRLGLLNSNFGGWTSVLAIIAFLTMTYGNLAAITQTNAKRLLAY